MKLNNNKPRALAWATSALMGAGMVAGMISSAAQAADVPTLGEVLGASGVEISGYVDTSYTYTDLGTDPMFRAFDTDANSFNVNMIGLSLSKLPEQGWGGAVVLNAGSDANVTAAAGSGGSDEFDIQQAYVSYASGSAQWLFGKFATLQGAEVIESKDNWNFSRSLLFFNAIPFTHTGVRVSFPLSDAIGLTVGVNNGWDNLVDDNASKSLEAQISLAPAENWFFNVQGMIGDEEANGKDESRTLIDIVTGWDVTEALSLLFNADFGTQENGAAGGKDASWSGYAAYVNYKFSPMWRIALRLESFSDDDGFRTGTKQTLQEGTVTLAYMPSEHVELRGEVRRDTSDEDVFMDDEGKPQDSQTSVAFEAIFIY